MVGAETRQDFYSLNLHIYTYVTTFLLLTNIPFVSFTLYLNTGHQPADGGLPALGLLLGHLHEPGPHAGRGRGRGGRRRGWRSRGRGRRESLQHAQRQLGGLHAGPGQQPGGGQAGPAQAAGEDPAGDPAAQAPRPAPPLPALGRQQRVHLHGGAGGGGPERHRQPAPW